MPPSDDLDDFRTKKAKEREKLREDAKRDLKKEGTMTPKISDAVLGALLPALQGKQGRAARSKAVRALNAVLRSNAPTAAPAFDPQGHAAAVARTHIIESSRALPGARIWLEPGFQRFSACTPREVQA